MADEPEITIDVPYLRRFIAEEFRRLHAELDETERVFADGIVRSLRVTPEGDGRFTLVLENGPPEPEPPAEPEMPAEATA